MSILVISDVHANMPALDAVLGDAERRAPIDAVWATGDLVGYGAEPEAVLGRLCEQRLVTVAGNHDLAACGSIGVEDFNSSAAAAALWTREQVSADRREWLAGLPRIRVEDGCTLAHGSIRDPVWEYLLSAEQALTQFELQTTPVSIVGHSHLSFVFEERSGATPRVLRMEDGDEIAATGPRLIVNAGSVGHPRDGDPRAAYVLYDDRERCFSWHRVEYDVEAAQQRIIAAGLPPWLAERLAIGT